MVTEIFKPIKDWDGLYEISSLGNVRSVRTGRILKPGYTGKGKNKYYAVNLSDKCNGRYHMRKIHRLVAETFIANTENKICINHINGVTSDNRLENLEWVTHSENTKHAYDIGLLKPCHTMAGVPKEYMKGEKNHKSKLTESNVHDIRGSKLLRAELARKYKVSFQTVDNIIKRKIWRHI